MKINVDDLIELLQKWKADGMKSIDFVVLVNLAKEIAIEQ